MTNEYTPAVLVGIITPQQPEDRTREYLDELAFLADTNHIEPVKRFVQRVEQTGVMLSMRGPKFQPSPYFVGSSSIFAAKRR